MLSPNRRFGPAFRGHPVPEQESGIVKIWSPGIYHPIDRCFRLIQINAFLPFAQSPQSVFEGRTNVPTDSLLVTIAVLVVFAFFMAVLGYASFDESRRLPGAKNRARIQSSRKPEASNMR